MRGCNSTGTSIISTVLFCLALTAAEFALADEPCGSAHGITTYCGFEGPEDIAQIPDSPFLIISQYAAHGQFKPGSLVSFNIETEEKQVLFPSEAKEDKARPLWGDKQCVAPEIFSPHGIDLVRRNDGDLMLLAVTHQAPYYTGSNIKPDLIQFFKVITDTQGPSLEWRGCVNVELGLALNDLAALPNGGFIVPATKTLPKNSHEGDAPQVTQPILSWNPVDGLSALLELDGIGGNEASISADGSILLVNDPMGGRVIKISLPDAKVIDTAAVPKVLDNHSWGEAGNLLATSIKFKPSLEDLTLCGQQKHNHCAVPFEITSVNPVTMQTTSLFKHDGVETFGGATIAVQVGDYLYLGCGFGDRIGRIKYPQSK